MHFGNDQYRIIWELDTEIATVLGLMVGKKKQGRQTIYDLPRPTWG